MHRNFLFDLDQTLLDFHASEYKALGIVLRANGLLFSDEIYRALKHTTSPSGWNLKKEPSQGQNCLQSGFWMFSAGAKEIQPGWIP